MVTEVSEGTLKMEATYSSETLITTYKITENHNPEVHIRHIHRYKNLNLRLENSFGC
jgi:hypothetical protein